MATTGKSTAKKTAQGSGEENFGAGTQGFAQDGNEENPREENHRAQGGGEEGTGQESRVAQGSGQEGGG
jgi:hypothetical protein